MEWQYAKDGYTTGDVQIGTCIPEAMKQLCLHIITYLLPHNSSVVWDHLQVEITWDSGQFIVLPASTVTPYRVEKVACQLVFEELVRRFRELVHMDIPDAEFEKHVSAEEKKYFTYFLKAARETELRGVRVIYSHGGGDPPLEDVII